MAALLLMSCLLLIFGLAETGALLRFPIDARMGVIIAIAILTAIRRIPEEQRLPWVVVACGFLVGVGVRQFGSPTLSPIAWFGFGVAALATTIVRRERIAATQPAKTYVAVSMLLTALVVAAILFFPPT